MHSINKVPQLFTVLQKLHAFLSYRQTNLIPCSLVWEWAFSTQLSCTHQRFKYGRDKNITLFYDNNFRDSLVARITVCRMVDRGSIPRLGASFFGFWWFVKQHPISMLKIVLQKYHVDMRHTAIQYCRRRFGWYELSGKSLISKKNETLVSSELYSSTHLVLHKCSQSQNHWNKYFPEVENIK